MNVQPRQPTDAALWAEVKARWRATSAGTEPGAWSSAKCALAVLDYERLGGRWQRKAEPGDPGAMVE